jgi:hypothetical protein
MKTSSTWNFRLLVGKIMMGLVLAAMIGSVDVAPALAKDDHKRVERHDNGRSEQRGRGHDRGRYVHGRGDYQPYGYAPPPVIYAPAPPLGISVFFPPIIIR